ncbi:MAG: hypothetical protein CMM26_12290 [Rhodospirillaceae bacterium]|nr:hypothetical protein [Rhodospirillaceae bacterium]
MEDLGDHQASAAIDEGATELRVVQRVERCQAAPCLCTEGDRTFELACIEPVIICKAVGDCILRHEDALAERRAELALMQLCEWIEGREYILNPDRVAIAGVGDSREAEAVGKVPVGFGNPVVYQMDAIGVGVGPNCVGAGGYCRAGQQPCDKGLCLYQSCRRVMVNGLNRVSRS